MTIQYRSQKLALAAALTATTLLAACSTTPATTENATLAQASETGDAAASKTTARLVKSGIQCKRIRQTGTNMPRKVCTSAAQRKRMEEEAKAFARNSGRLAGANSRLETQATRVHTRNK